MANNPSSRDDGLTSGRLTTGRGTNRFGAGALGLRPLAQLGDSELEQAVEEVMKVNELLQKENELFSSYLGRVNPAMAAAPDDDDNKQDKRRGGRQSQANRKKDKPVQLTREQKYLIAINETEEIKESIEKAKKQSEQLQDNLKALIEESDVKIAEIKREAYEYKRDIVVGAENYRTGKTIAEKVVKYMEENLRAKDALIEKLRLKNASLKTQVAKMENQLQQKEEMGEVLHVIDFDQLKIENQQYLEKIEERNNELLRLKLTTGNTVQVLNNLKKKLNNLTSESDWLKKEIGQREEVLEKIVDEISQVNGEMEAEEKTNKRLKRNKEEFANAPQVMDYISRKAEIYELQHDIKAWERKVEIAELTYKRYKGLHLQANAEAGARLAGIH
eukprot:GFYU01005006.1.p1 GENE.GFYU01005006.1~~GFYU01005006.1.p1  ORF type:complete len:400 (-),score=158.62 GFYU01005006.1:213-1379(-)